MTIYRRNPLLMTVMGMNPGPRTRAGAERLLDKQIAAAWHRIMSGVQVSVMDIPKIFRDIKLEVAAGMSVEEAVFRVGERFRVNPGRRFHRRVRHNPMGEAILGGVAGALVNRVFQRNGMYCEICDAAAHECVVDSTGEHWYCPRHVPKKDNPGPSFIVIDAELGYVTYSHRAAGTGDEAMRKACQKAELLANRRGRPHVVFLDLGYLRVGSKVDMRAIRAQGISQEFFPKRYGRGPQPLENPAIRTSWDGLTGRQRLAILEFAGIDEERAIMLSRKSWETLGAIDPEARRQVTRGWRDSSRTSSRHGTTVRMNPRGDGLRPKSAKKWCRMCGEWLREKGPYHVMKVGPQKGTMICDLCYRGIRSGRRMGEKWAQNPKSNPGPKGTRRKFTMSIAQFAAWVKRKNDPKMWRAFLEKFRGYEKWTHGARAKKVHIEWVDTPGVDGLWITYDGGKQPESTYIMPKGSKRKGAWKHPWDTMPDIKHDPQAKIVITKLRGQSKITDFYHK